MGTAIDLVVTDLDGTLWEAEGELHPEARRALDALDERDVTLLVATGRRTGSARRALAQVELAPPAVVLNGSLGVHLDTGDRFHLGGFAGGEARDVLAAFSSVGVDPCVYVDGEAPAVFVSDTPATHPDHIESFGGSVRVARLDEVVANEHVLAFGVLGIERDLGASIDRALADVATAHFDVDRKYGGHALTVAPQGDSKWAGVLAFCERYGVDPSCVIAVGDGANDVEMLSAAAIAVVPADGHAAALDVADHVIRTAADGGWAGVLDLL